MLLADTEQQGAEKWELSASDRGPLLIRKGHQTTRRRRGRGVEGVDTTSQQWCELMGPEKCGETTNNAEGLTVGMDVSQSLPRSVTELHTQALLQDQRNVRLG